MSAWRIALRVLDGFHFVLCAQFLQVVDMRDQALICHSDLCCAQSGERQLHLEKFSIQWWPCLRPLPSIHHGGRVADRQRFAAAQNS